MCLMNDVTGLSVVWMGKVMVAVPWGHDMCLQVMLWGCRLVAI